MSCLFCRIVAGEIPAKTVYADDDVVAFEDIHPQAPMHVLVVPRAHIPTLNDLGPGHDAHFRGLTAGFGLTKNGLIAAHARNEVASET